MPGKAPWAKEAAAGNADSYAAYGQGKQTDSVPTCDMESSSQSGQIAAAAYQQPWTIPQLCSSSLPALSSTDQLYVSQQWAPLLGAEQAESDQTASLVVGIPSHQSINVPSSHAMTLPDVSPNTLAQQNEEYRPVFQHQAGVDY